jgi:hypothetical protein
MSSMQSACKSDQSFSLRQSFVNEPYRTPWLTTRRRTCPICKGDVVRSFAAANSHLGSSSSSSSASSSPSRRSFHLAHATTNSDFTPPHHDLGFGHDPGTTDITSSTIQDVAALRRNDDPSAALPVPQELDEDDIYRSGGDSDVERGERGRRGDGTAAGPVLAFGSPTAALSQVLQGVWERINLGASEVAARIGGRETRLGRRPRRGSVDRDR